MIASAWNSLHETRRRFGWGAVARRCVDAGGRRLCRLGVEHIVWLPLEHAPQSPPDWPGWSFRLLTPEEVAHHAQDPAYDMGPEMAERMREKGDACFAILEGERLANYGFYARRNITPEASGLGFDYPGLLLPPDVAYMYKGFTHPDYRGKGLHGWSIGLALRALAPQGVRALVSNVHWTNEASLHGCAKLGFVQLGLLIQASLGKHTWLRVPRAVRQVGVDYRFDVTPEQRPTTAIATSP
jgi:RimJ/RimL family protein N-acetyltransferase